MSAVDRATLHPKGFNDGVALPYGLRGGEVKAALDDVYDFFYNVNKFLVEKGWDRLEETLSAAALSGMLSEMIVQGISKRSATVTKNRHHNGRPDLVPRGHYAGDSVLRGEEGIEVKASRYSAGWQGHNIESGWIMIAQYYVQVDEPTLIDRVLAAKLDPGDWSFSGRGALSRRTPTASIKKSGVSKLETNPIYVDPNYRPRPAPKRQATVIESEIVEG